MRSRTQTKKPKSEKSQKVSQKVNRRLVHTKQFIEPHRKNPYRSQSKPEAQAVCPECGALNSKGRWNQKPALLKKRITRSETRAPVKKEGLSNYNLDINSAKMNSILCPACRQAKEKYAMGVVELHGNHWKEKKNDIFKTIEGSEKIARSRNDQERILWTQTSKGVTKFYVTLPELARHIGRTLKKAFKGEINYNKTKEEPFLRVQWFSDSLPSKKNKK